MTTTVADLESEIRGYLKDSDQNTGATFFSSSEIMKYLQRAIDELCWSTQINYRPYDYTAVETLSEISYILLTGSVESKLYDQGWLLFKESSDDRYQQLWVVTPQDNRNFVNDDDARVTCEIYDDKIVFNRDIVAGDKIAVAGRWKKADLVNSATVFPLDSSAEGACVAYSVAMGMYKREKLETGDRWFQQWMSRKNEIEKRISKFLNVDAPAGLTLNKTSSRNFYFNRQIDIV